MKIKKKFLILNEAIQDVDKIQRDDRIKFTFNNGSAIVLKVKGIFSDKITLVDDKGVLYSIRKESLTQDNANIEFIRSHGGKSMKDTAELKTVKHENPDLNVPEPEEEEEESEEEKINKAIEADEQSMEEQEAINDFFELAGSLRNGETISLIGNGKVLELSLEEKFDNGSLSMDYVSHRGDLGGDEENIVNSMDIIFHPNQTSVDIPKREKNKQRRDALYNFKVTLQFEDKESATATISNIINTRVKSSDKLERQDKLIDELFSLDVGSNFMLMGEPDDKNFKPTSELYFKVIDKDMAEGSIDVKYFRGTNVKPSDVKELDKIANTSSMISTESFELTSDKTGKMKFFIPDGVAVINIVNKVNPINRTEDEVKEKSFATLSPEEQKDILFNDLSVRQSLLSRPSLFGRLFGKKNVGLIPAMQLADKKRFGDGAKKFKSNRKLAFSFVGPYEDPFYDGRFVGKYESGGEFGGGLIKHQHKDERKNKLDYRSTLHIKDVEDNDEDTYNVLVITERINPRTGNAKQVERYNTVIKIENFNIS